MTARERVARAWHAGSDHAADGAPFGGPLCNCYRVAERMLPMLADAWWEGFDAGWSAQYPDDHTPNPYEEDRHVDQ